MAIDEALEETGTAAVRRRKIPAQLVVWLVIGMAMFRDRSIPEVVSHLGLVLPSQKKKRPAAGRGLAPSAVTQARYRVGAAPLVFIFGRRAETWSTTAAEENRWRGLTAYGVDGTVLPVPDTDENREAFGLPGSSRGQAGYPQVRLVALMALRSHLISAVALGPCSGKKTGEFALAEQLWIQLPDEICGILLAYNLVRKEMLDVAEAAGVPPVRVSFRHSLMFIRVFRTVEAWTCAPGNLPERLSSLHEVMRSRLKLPERRPDRRYERHVKIRMSDFKRNPGRPVAKGSNWPRYHAI